MLPPSWKGEVQKAVDEATASYTDAQKRAGEENLKIASRIETLTNELARYNAKQEREEPSKRSRENWTIRGLVATAVFTFALAGFSAWQVFESKRAYGPIERSANAAHDAADAANRQVAISADTEQRQLRAYIGASPDHMIKNHNGDWAIQVAAHNYGQTPAYALQINGGAPLLPPHQDRDGLPDRLFAYERTDYSSGLVVFPKKDGTTSLPAFDSDAIAKFRNYSGPLKVFAAGIVTYKDAFGNLQRTTYCAIIDPVDIIKVIDNPGAMITFDWCIERYNRAT